MNELSKLFVTLSLNASEYTRELNRMVGQAASTGQQLGSRLAGGLTRALQIGLAGVTTALAGTFALAIKSASDLESQVSGVQAVLQTTDDVAQDLKTSIIDLSVDPTLKVNVTEAADAFELLARNGLTASQIMDGAAKATVLLANATGAEFGVAADLATDSMLLFNIGVDEMETAVDGITSVVNNSKFDINDYALALSRGGGVAAAVGVEFDDFNATIAAIAPNFSSGQTAGTAFKTMLTRLIPKTSRQAGAMRELGLANINTNRAYEWLTEQGFQPLGDSMEDITAALMVLQEETGKSDEFMRKMLVSTGIMQSSFFDAEGSLLSMAEISGMLSDALSDLSEEDRISKLTDIFGTEGMQAASALMRTTTEDFEALRAAMAETSAAENARIRIDNLAGAVEIFRSILSGLLVQIGDAFLPLLEDMVNFAAPLVATYGGILVNAISAFSNVIQNTIVNGGTFTDFLDGLIGSFSGFTGFEFIADGAQLLRDALQWHADNSEIIIGAIKGVAAAFATFTVIATVTSLVAALANPITIIIGLAAALGAAWQTNFLGIRDVTAAIWSVVQPILSGIVSWLGDIAAQVAAGDFSGALDTLKTGVQTAFEFIRGIDWQTLATGIVDTISGGMSQLWANVQPRLTEFWESVRTWFITTPWQQLAIDVVTQWVNEIALFWQKAQPQVAAFWTQINEWFNATEWQAFGVTVVNGVVNALGTFWTGGDGSGGALAKMTEWYTSIVSWFDGINWQDLGYTVTTRIIEALNNFFNGGGEGESAAETLDRWWVDIRNWFESIDWVSLGTLIVDAVVSGLRVYVSVINAINEIIRGVFQAFNEVDFAPLGGGIIDGIVSGLQNAAGRLWQAAQDAVTGALDAASQAIGFNSPATAFIPLGVSIPQGVEAGIVDEMGDLMRTIDDMGRATVDVLADNLAFDLFAPSVALSQILSIVDVPTIELPDIDTLEIEDAPRIEIDAPDIPDIAVNSNGNDSGTNNSNGTSIGGDVIINVEATDLQDSDAFADFLAERVLESFGG